MKEYIFSIKWPHIYKVINLGLPPIISNNNVIIKSTIENFKILRNFNITSTYPHTTKKWTISSQKKFKIQITKLQKRKKLRKREKYIEKIKTEKTRKNMYNFFNKLIKNPQKF